MKLNRSKLKVAVPYIIRCSLALAVGFFAYQYFAVPEHASAATTKQVLASSNQSTNSALYYSLKSYAGMRSQASWPMCYGRYKTVPWLPDNTGPSAQGALSASSSPTYNDGNGFYTSGNCIDRYVDGGGGAWLSPYAVGGWATNGSVGGFGSYYTGTSAVASCSNLYGGSAQMIWGYPGRDSSDQMYGYGGLMWYNGFNTTIPAAPKDWRVYSNGTTLIRNSFTISAEQYSAIQSGYGVRFYAVGDDWINVYLNGVQIGSTSYSAQSISTSTIPSSYFKSGTNLIAIQVADKAIFRRDDSISRGSGVCYNLTGDLPDNSVPPPSPATLNGAKIDDSGSGTYGGDETNGAYKSLSVSVSGASATTANPFTISTNSGSNTVSVNTSGIGSGWAVVGHSICDTTTQADCSSSTLQYGGKYYSASSATSFSYSFTGGHSYQMRWIFKNQISVSCGTLTTNPVLLDPATSFTTHVTINLGTNTYNPKNESITLTISPASAGASWTYGPSVRSTNVDSSGTASATFGPMGPATTAGYYTVSWIYNGYDDDVNDSIGAACSAQILVINRPYLTVYGGDTLVGAAATNVPGTCYSGSSDAGAYSWSDHSNSYLGAGSQYAVMALGQIQDFASNLGGNGGAADPRKLSFANTDPSVTNVSAGLFGGKFGGATATCDLTSDLIRDGITPTGNEGDIPSTVQDGVVKTVFISGDVNITHDVKYQNTSWSSVQDMPSFRLVVIGNIYIQKEVGQLDGTYIALPDSSGNGGVIYTCSNPGTAAAPTDPNYYKDCDKQLTINGAFAAKQVQFLRTYGTLGLAKTDSFGNSHAGEQFNFSPEVWLPRGYKTPSFQYDSITGLPPVL